MCGIAGMSFSTSLTTDDSFYQQLTDSFSASLAHRGPDGQGSFRTTSVFLFHRRLSVIAPGDGAQPIENDEAVLVGNGEIYNHRLLWENLQTSYPEIIPKTHSDCEPPLYLWHREGNDFVKKLRGMYALALYNKQTEALTLTRDPFGIKPLYIRETGEGIAFASEARALYQTPFAKTSLLSEKRGELLQLGFSTGTETVFAGIRRLAPGESLYLKNGKITGSSVLQALPQTVSPITSADEALQAFGTALKDSVAHHFAADVPCGMFLSGGLDSSAVLTAAHQSGTLPLVAFTADFEAETVAAESEKAALLAGHFGIKHEKLLITRQMFVDFLPQIIACLDDPTFDFAVIPTWFLAKEAKKSVTVILSGEGGDELLAGYGRYRSALRAKWLGGKPMRRHGLLERAGLSLKDFSRQDLAKTLRQIEKTPQEGSKLRQLQAQDCAAWLPYDLLTKLDRCLMAQAVEGRTPFLDPVVAQIVFGLPDNFKIRHGQGKWLLRQWLSEQRIPVEAFADKQGFTVPVGEWIFTLQDQLAPLVASVPGIAELFDRPTVLSLFAKSDRRHFDQAARILLFYALWYRIHIENCPPTGDIFHVLNSRA